MVALQIRDLLDLEAIAANEDEEDEEEEIFVSHNCSSQAHVRAINVYLIGAGFLDDDEQTSDDERGNPHAEIELEGGTARIVARSERSMLSSRVATDRNDLPFRVPYPTDLGLWCVRVKVSVLHLYICGY